MPLEESVLCSVVIGFVEFAMSEGLDRTRVVQAAGLTPDDLADPDGRVPAMSLVFLWGYLKNALPHLVLPLALVDRVNARLGLLGHILRTCSGLEEAAELARRYRRLFDAAL